MGKKAFTLVELLITIAIIGLLVAMLLPSLKKAREQSRSAACSLNLKQLATALANYSIQNQAYPSGFNNAPAYVTSPPQGGFLGYQNCDDGDGNGWFWFHFLEEYTDLISRKNSAIRCPSRRIKDPGVRENPLWGNYGVNISVCRKYPAQFGKEEFSGTAVRPDSICRPSETLLVMDAGYPTLFWWQATLNPPPPGLPKTPTTRDNSSYIPGLSINAQRTDIYPEQQTDALEGRHLQKTVNIGFVDGHVSHKSAEYTLVEKNGDGSYANRFFLWTPTQCSP